jgi:hypothetical protein
MNRNERRVASREPQNRALIFVEGSTEELYLKSLVERGVNVKIITLTSHEKTPRQMVNNCKTRMKDQGIDLKNGDKVFCVFDVDRNEKENFEESYRLAEKEGIMLIVSNPCFEIWPLFHFLRYDGTKLTCKEISEKLSKHLKSKYSKTNDYRKVYNPLREKAIQNSKDAATERSLRTPVDFFNTPNSTTCI